MMATEWYDGEGATLQLPPDEAVEECSQSGQVVEYVKKWRATLGFNVDRKMGVAYIVRTGVHDKEELADWTDNDVNEFILWQACCDVKENGEHIGIGI
jgi:hypothetical protein